MKRYMMSDIHGFLEAFEVALKKTDLSGKNQLILLGDYIDYCLLYTSPSPQRIMVRHVVMQYSKITAGQKK